MYQKVLNPFLNPTFLELHRVLPVYPLWNYEPPNEGYHVYLSAFDKPPACGKFKSNVYSLISIKWETSHSHWPQTRLPCNFQMVYLEYSSSRRSQRVSPPHQSLLLYSLVINWRINVVILLLSLQVPPARVSLTPTLHSFPNSLFPIIWCLLWFLFTLALLITTSNLSNPMSLTLLPLASWSLMLSFLHFHHLSLHLFHPNT